MHLSFLAALVAGAAALFACSADGSFDSAFGPERAAGAEEPDGSKTFASDPSPAAGGVTGSLLCGYVGDSGECLPDDDGTPPAGMGFITARAGGCATPPSDAGAPDATVRACRIRTEGTAGPECFERADRRGVDGVACRSGADCAPGFDCMRERGEGACRRYCCSGSCANRTSANAGPTFCDVQLLAASERRAPVCMPLKKCKLLVPAECSRGETCGVLTEKGDVGCVEVGPAAAGESCEATHCAEGLTCLGSPGNRRCYTLCRVEGSTCPIGQRCTTGALFSDPAYGVCR